MTYTTLATVKFYDLSRYLTENQDANELDRDALVTELSKKFDVSTEKIEIDPQARMSIIYCA